MDRPVRDACIVAGGRGTRLQPLTYTAPKPLLPFCGAPFLSGVIRRLAASGVRRVLLVVGADTAPFEVLRADAEAAGVTIEMVPEPEPLDTAGGVRRVVERVDDAFLVLNGDILTDVDYAAVVRRHREVGAAGTIVLTAVEDTSSYGVCVLDGSRIVAFVEKPAPGSLPGQNAINAGTYVLEPEVLAAYPDGPLSFEREVFPGLVSSGQHLEGVVWDGVWADLGTPERYRTGHRLALDGALRWPFVDAVPERGPGVRVADGADVHPDATLVPPVLVLAEATIAAGATVGPHVVVGRGSRVGPGARLVDAVLFDHVDIGPEIEATGLLAGHRVTVPGEASLGNGVVIGDDETVARDLADGARVPPATG